MMDKLHITPEEHQRARNMMRVWSFTKLTFIDALEMIRNVDSAQTTPAQATLQSDDSKVDDENIHDSKRRKIIKDTSNTWTEYNTSFVTFPICGSVPTTQKPNFSTLSFKDGKENGLNEEEFCIDTGLCVIWG